MIGIYRIRNVINDDCYYGSSKNIIKRMNNHRKHLNKGTHINILLQRAWDKYGESNFLFEVVEECGLDDLLKIEQIYLDNSPRYNIGKNSSGGDNITNHPLRDLISEKQRLNIKERWGNYSDEYKKEYSEKHKGEGNPNWKGGGVFCICGNKIAVGNKTCVTCRDKSGDKNPFYGKRHSEETKTILKNANTGKFNGVQSTAVVIEGLHYLSLGDASRQLNINVTTIRHRVNSKNPKFKNWNYLGTVKKSYTDDDVKQIYSDAQKGLTRPHNKPILIDGVEYRTLKEAADFVNMSIAGIKSRVLSKSDKFKNYKYK